MSRLNVNQIYTRTGTGSPAIREMPAFKVYTETTASVTNATQTKIPYDTVDFDTNSWFDTSNNRYVPQIAGYYQFSVIVTGTATSSTFFTNTLYKNGSALDTLHRSRVSTSSTQTMSNSTLVYLNGSTDYVEIFMRIDGSGGNAFATPNILNGFLVRPD